MKTITFKVAVEDLNEADLPRIEAHTKSRIKAFVLKQNFKFFPFADMKKRLRIPDKFFEFRHTCMNCGETKEMSAYCIAQLTMGHKINYTCDCKHVTILPQLLPA